MPLNQPFGQQQQGWLDRHEEPPHGSIKYGLAAAFTIGGHFVARSYPHVPEVVFLGVGAVTGLLGFALFINGIKALGYGLVIAAAAYATWLLLSSGDAKPRQTVPTQQQQAAPSHNAAPSWLSDLLAEVIAK